MLRVHTKDGQTRSFDLSDPEAAREWLRLTSDDSYQGQVTGLTLASSHCARGVCSACGSKNVLPLTIQYSTARPQDFRRISLVAEDVPRAPGVNGGERVIVFADDVRLTLMAHSANPAVRIVLSKVGHRKFDPNGR